MLYCFLYQITLKFMCQSHEMHLSNLSLLKFLDVSQNSFSFNLSSNWVPPFQLETLFASMCTLGPKFPTWLKHFPELSELEISNCSISDSFPEWFWGLTVNLEYLNVSHNKLYGPLPKSFLGLDFKYNNLWDFSFNENYNHIYNITSIISFQLRITALILSRVFIQHA